MMAEDEFKYDVFISYRWVWPDRCWVRKRLVPALKASALKVWLDVEHQTEPNSIYDLTAEAISSSRRIICVITPAYLRETRKPASWVAYEYKLLLKHKDRVLPLLLRGRIPDGIGDLLRYEWFYPRKCEPQWKDFLTALKASDVETAPPAGFELYLQFITVWMLRIFFAVLLTVAAVWSIVWLTQRTNEVPDLIITTVSGQPAQSDMTVAPSGSIAGEVKGKVGAQWKVFVYLQRKGGDYDQLWQCVGTTRVAGTVWSLNNIDFRLPFNRRATKTTVHALLQKDDQQCGVSLHESDFNELTKSVVTSATPLRVNVPPPRANIGEVSLDRTQMFSASGTTENILEDLEDLCVWVNVRRNSNAVSNQCFKTSSSGGRWTVAKEPLESELKITDMYVVEVGLVPKEFKGHVRPDDFFVLDSKTGSGFDLLSFLLTVFATGEKNASQPAPSPTP